MRNKKAKQLKNAAIELSWRPAENLMRCLSLMGANRPRRIIARLVKIGKLPLEKLPKHPSINGTNTLDNYHGSAYPLFTVK